MNKRRKLKASKTSMTSLINISSSDVSSNCARYWKAVANNKAKFRNILYEPIQSFKVSESGRIQTFSECLNISAFSDFCILMTLVRQRFSAAIESRTMLMSDYKNWSEWRLSWFDGRRSRCWRFKWLQILSTLQGRNLNNSQIFNSLFKVQV